MARVDIPAPQPTPQVGNLLPPVRSQAKPVSPQAAAETKRLLGVQTKADKKKKADETFQVSDITGWFTHPSRIYEPSLKFLPMATIGAAKMGYDISRQVIPKIPFLPEGAPQPHSDKFVHDVVHEAKLLGSGELFGDIGRAVKRGEFPLPQTVRVAGDVAIVAGGLSKALSAGGAAAAEAGALGGEAAAASGQAGAATGMRAAAAEAATNLAGKLKTVEHGAMKVANAPFTVPIKGVDLGLEKLGEMRRAKAARLFEEANAMEAEAKAAGRLPPSDARVKRAQAMEIEARWGKDITVGGVVNTVTSKAVNKFAKRVGFQAQRNGDMIGHAMLEVVDKPEFVDAINPETNQPFGPLNPAEQQAIMATLNGRAALIRSIAERLRMTPGEVSHLGRLPYAEGFSLTPEGANLAVDFLNNNLPPEQYSRLATAAQQVSDIIEKQTEKARAGYGRRSPLGPQYDVPTPMPDRLVQALRRAGRDDLAQQVSDLLDQGYFDDPKNLDAQTFLHSIIEQSPPQVALNQLIYPAKERNNIVFYKRVREAFDAQAGFTVRGTPPPREPGGPTVGPMNEGAATGLQPEARYADVKYPGELNRTPRQFIINSIKALEKLRGRARQLGERIADAEIAISKRERAVIKIQLQIEELTGGFVDKNGNRIIPDENGRVPADARRVPGVIERLRTQRDQLRAAYDEMVRQQADSTVMNNVVVSKTQLEDAIAKTEEAVANVEGVINNLDQQASAIEDAITTIENEQANIANDLADEGVDPQGILDAASKDGEAIMTSPADIPEASQLVSDAVTTATDLRDAQMAVEKATQDQAAARTAEVDARAAFQDIETKFREQQAAAQAASQAAGAAPTPSRDQVLSVLNDAADKGQLPSKVVKAVEKAYDAKYEPPKTGSSAKAVDKAVFSGKSGGLRDFRGAMVSVVDGRVYWSDSYVIVEVDPSSKVGQKLAEVNNESGKYGTSAAGGARADMERAPLVRTGDAPNFKPILDAAKETAKAAPAKIVGIDLTGDGTVVILETPEGVRVPVQADNLNKVYEAGDTIHAVEATKPVVVKRGDKIVGVAMPLRGEFAPMTPDILYGKIRSGQFGSLGNLGDVLDSLAPAPAQPRLKAPSGKLITPDEVAAAATKWNAAQSTVSMADKALLDAQNALRGIQDAASQTPGVVEAMAPPIQAGATKEQMIEALDRVQKNLERDAAKQLKTLSDELVKVQSEISQGNTEALNGRDMNQPDREAAGKQRKSAGQKRKRELIKQRAVVIDKIVNDLRDRAATYQEFIKENNTSAVVENPDAIDVQVARERIVEAQAEQAKLEQRLKTELQRFSELDQEYRGYANPQGARPQQVLREMRASTDQIRRLTTNYALEARTIGVAEQRIARFEELATGPRLASPIDNLAQAKAAEAEAAKARSDAYDAYITAQSENSPQVDQLRDEYTKRLSEWQQAKYKLQQAQTAARAGETITEPRLQQPKTMADAYAEQAAVDQADAAQAGQEPVVTDVQAPQWTPTETGSQKINTGYRDYELTQREAGTNKKGQPKYEFELRRYGLDGEVIESSTQVFKSEAAAKKYVAETIAIDAEYVKGRAVYRPGRELGQPSLTPMPPELIAAETKLGQAEKRLASLEAKAQTSADKIDNLRVQNARRRALLPMVEAARTRLEARLGKEIITQTDVAVTEQGPTGRVFVGQEAGPPRILQPLSDVGVPRIGGSPVGAGLRPFAEYTVDTAGIDMVTRSIDEANLRRGEMLPPSLPLRVAMEQPMEPGQPFRGSQYTPGTRPAEYAPGVRREVTPGLVGEVPLPSERLRTGESYEYYDLLKLAKRLSDEQRLMDYKEAFRFLLSPQSKMNVKPRDFLGDQMIAEFEARAYDMTFGKGTTIDGRIEGKAAYVEGLPNREAVARRVYRETLGRLIDEEMRRRGFDTPPLKGSIDNPVPMADITPDQPYLPNFVRDQVMQKIQTGTGQIPKVVENYLRRATKVNTVFKNLTLPPSTTWQLGDLIGNFVSAAVSGVPPTVLARYMLDAMSNLYGEDLTRWQQFRQAFKEPGTQPMNYAGEVMSESGLQDTGLRISQQQRYRGQEPGAEPMTRPQELLNRVTPDIPRPTFRNGQWEWTGSNIGNLYPAFRKRAYRLNEFINKVQRNAYALAKFDQALAKLAEDSGAAKMTYNDVFANDLHLKDPYVKQAFEDVIGTSNDVLGDWLDLNSFEKQWILPHVTFYAWVKHINKLFLKIARDNPSAITWSVYLGQMAYDPSTDAFQLYAGKLRTFGGWASSNFLNPFADVIEGTIGKFLMDQDPRSLTAALAPMPRLIAAGAFGYNLPRMRSITRPSGTGMVLPSGTPISPPLIFRPTEFAGYAAQQFPLVSKVLDVLPSGTIPGTDIATGPTERYDTGAARLKSGTKKRIEKVGGRPVAALKLLNLPFLPTTNDKRINEIKLRAQQRLKAFETAKKKAEAGG